MTKEERLEKFNKEHPHFKMDDIMYQRRLRIEKSRLEQKTATMIRVGQILELRYKNDMSLKEIGEKFGISGARIQQIIGKDLYSPE